MIVCGICQSVDKKQISKYHTCCTKIKLVLRCSALFLHRIVKLSVAYHVAVVDSCIALLHSEFISVFFNLLLFFTGFFAHIAHLLIKLRVESFLGFLGFLDFLCCLQGRRRQAWSLRGPAGGPGNQENQENQ